MLHFLVVSFLTAHAEEVYKEPLTPITFVYWNDRWVNHALNALRRRSFPTIPDLDPRLLTWTGTLDLLVIFSILPKSKDAFK